jgi:hypothetical protein
MALTAGVIYPSGEVRLVRSPISSLSDETIRRPLWEFTPDERPAVIHERRRRNILQGDPEPSGDSEYS